MPKGPKGIRRPADTNSAAVMVGRIATGEVEDTPSVAPGRAAGGNRRLTRLTNAFSKKLENHSHSLAVYFFFYNFCRIHKSLKVTPAMRAGVSDRLMEMADLVAVIDTMAEPLKPRGPYRKRAV